MRVQLRENGEPVLVGLPLDVGVRLAEAAFVEVRHLPGSRDRWELRPGSKVGALRVGDVEVHVAPKLDVSRVMFLVGYSDKGVRWRDDTVTVRPAEDLLPAVAEAFARLAEAATRQGLLQGYRSRDEALMVVRGRIREADQLRRRPGLPLPVEVRYDDFTVDIAENRLLLGALAVVRRIPGLTKNLRHRLARLQHRLADVTPPIRGVPPEPWHASRLNARYADALRLAEVILASASFEPAHDGDGTHLVVTGFVLDMAKVFEDFVTRVMAARFRQVGGRVALQDQWHLDSADSVKLRPDLVWYPSPGDPRALGRAGAGAVVDAKYKAERNDAFSNADLYQLLAYVTSMELAHGDLVYAKGHQEGKRHLIRGSGGIVIHAHALDLSASPDNVIAQLDAITDAVAARDLVHASDS